MPKYSLSPSKLSVESNEYVPSFYKEQEVALKKCKNARKM